MILQPRTVTRILTLLLALGLPLTIEAAGEPVEASCAVTETLLAHPPNDPNADPFGEGPWYINADRSIWAGWDASRLTAGEQGNKVLWIRPAGTQLQISGRLLDGEPESFVAFVPDGYPTGFQATGLTFSRPGCWEITATAGKSSLVFVTLVR